MGDKNLSWALTSRTLMDRKVFDQPPPLKNTYTYHLDIHRLLELEACLDIT